MRPAVGQQLPHHDTNLGISECGLVWPHDAAGSPGVEIDSSVSRPESQYEVKSSLIQTEGVGFVGGDTIWYE